MTLHRVPLFPVPLLALIVACATGETRPSPAPSPATPVRVAPIVRVERARSIRATGQLAAKSEIRASFKVGGLIRTIAVDEGAPVRRGQVLATLTTTEIDAGVEQARQALTKAERDLARVQQLVSGRAATGSQLDDATTGVAIAKAQLRAAEFNREHAVIRAPRDGRVLRRLAEPDELVGPGQPILLLAADDLGWVLRIGLADRDVVRLAEGDPASVVFPAWPDAEPLRARVSEIASAASPQLGTYEVELRVEPGGRALRSGLFAHASIEPGARERVALIPALALRDGDARSASVWVPAANGRVTLRRVEIAFFDGEHAAIRSGLDAIEGVITDGAAYLHEGSTIEVVP